MPQFYKWLVLMALAVGAMCGSTGVLLADTVTVQTGFLTTSNGSVTGNSDWADGYDGFRIGWNIVVDQNTGVFTYTYDVSDKNGGGLDKNLSHLIIQVSDNFMSSDLLSTNVNAQLGTYTASGNGDSNPGMPSGIYGLKFEPFSGAGPYSIVISTLRAPGEASLA